MNFLTRTFFFIVGFFISSLSYSADREIEPNENYSQATSLALNGSEFRGQLSSSSDIDTYKFTASQPGKLIFKVAPENDTYDGGIISFNIKDSNNNTLATREFSSSDGEANVEIVAESGDYYVVVNAKTGYQIFDKDYVVTPSIDTSDGYLNSREIEPNENHSQATALTLDNPEFRGQLSSRSDIDTYKFVVTQPGTLSFKVAPENNTYDGGIISFSIKDDNSNILASREFSSSDSEANVEATVTASGNYYAVVYAKTGYIIFDKDYVVTPSIDTPQTPIPTPTPTPIVISTTSSSAIDIVQKAYLSYYGRPGDPGGIDYWALKLDTVGSSWSTGILDAFGNSSEFQSQFGNFSPSELVNNIYMQLFNREAEQAGLDYFISLLTSEQSSLSQISVDILNGAAGDDAITINNKLLVCDYFSQKVAGGMTYSSTDAAKSILANVTSSSSTVATAYSAIDTLDTQ